MAGKSIPVCSSCRGWGNGGGSSTFSSCQDLRQVFGCSGRGARTIPGEKPWDGGVGKALGSCSTPEKPSVAKWLLHKAAVAPGGHSSTSDALQCCFLITSLKIPCNGTLLISCLILGYQECSEQERNLPWLPISLGRKKMK